jgi:large subunit ribosomal protein L30e
MAAKKSSQYIIEIKKNLEEGNIKIGTNSTMKSLKTGLIKKVFVTKNCPDTVKNDLSYYKKIKDFEIADIPLTNEELGNICKKPFSISILGLVK